MARRNISFEGVNMNVGFPVMTGGVPLDIIDKTATRLTNQHWENWGIWQQSHNSLNAMPVNDYENTQAIKKGLVDELDGNVNAAVKDGEWFNADVKKAAVSEASRIMTDERFIRLQQDYAKKQSILEANSKSGFDPTFVAIQNAKNESHDNNLYVDSKTGKVTGGYYGEILPEYVNPTDVMNKAKDWIKLFNPNQSISEQLGQYGNQIVDSAGNKFTEFVAKRTDDIETLSIGDVQNFLMSFIMSDRKLLASMGKEAELSLLSTTLNQASPFDAKGGFNKEGMRQINAQSLKGMAGQFGYSPAVAATMNGIDVVKYDKDEAYRNEINSKFGVDSKEALQASLIGNVSNLSNWLTNEFKDYSPEEIADLYRQTYISNMVSGIVGSAANGVAYRKDKTKWELQQSAAYNQANKFQYDVLLAQQKHMYDQEDIEARAIWGIVADSMKPSKGGVDGNGNGIAGGYGSTYFSTYDGTADHEKDFGYDFNDRDTNIKLQEAKLHEMTDRVNKINDANTPMNELISLLEIPPFDVSVTDKEQAEIVAKSLVDYNTNYKNFKASVEQTRQAYEHDKGIYDKIISENIKDMDRYYGTNLNTKEFEQTPDYQALAKSVLDNQSNNFTRFLEKGKVNTHIMLAVNKGIQQYINNVKNNNFDVTPEETAAKELAKELGVNSNTIDNSINKVMNNALKNVKDNFYKELVKKGKLSDATIVGKGQYHVVNTNDPVITREMGLLHESLLAGGLQGTILSSNIDGVKVGEPIESSALLKNIMKQRNDTKETVTDKDHKPVSYQNQTRIRPVIANADMKGLKQGDMPVRIENVDNNGNVISWALVSIPFDKAGTQINVLGQMYNNSGNDSQSIESRKFAAIQMGRAEEVTAVESYSGFGNINVSGAKSFRDVELLMTNAKEGATMTIKLNNTTSLAGDYMMTITKVNSNGSLKYNVVFKDRHGVPVKSTEEHLFPDQVRGVINYNNLSDVAMDIPSKVFGARAYPYGGGNGNIGNLKAVYESVKKSFNLQ